MAVWLMDAIKGGQGNAVLVDPTVDELALSCPIGRPRR